MENSTKRSCTCIGIESEPLCKLENPGKINVEIIEVQTGAYPEEDDIVRVENGYARS